MVNGLHLYSAFIQSAVQFMYNKKTECDPCNTLQKCLDRKNTTEKVTHNTVLEGSTISSLIGNW